MWRLLAILAFVGFGLSVLFHLALLEGGTFPDGIGGGFFALHIGAVLLAQPITRRLRAIKKRGRNFTFGAMWSYKTTTFPIWARAVTMTLLVYSLSYLVVFIGSAVLDNATVGIAHTIWSAQGFMERMFSSVWMYLYFFMGMVYWLPAPKTKNDAKPKRGQPDSARGSAFNDFDY